MTPSSPSHIQRSNYKSASFTYSINVHEPRCMLVREGDHVTQTNQSPSQGENCQAPTQRLPVHVLWSPLQDLAPSRLSLKPWMASNDRAAMCLKTGGEMFGTTR